MHQLFFRCLTLNGRMIKIVSLVMIAALIPIYGCGGRSRPAYQIDQYLLSYDSPPIETSGPVNESLKFSRFAAASAYSGTHMAFRLPDRRIDAFNYSRWAVNPADMTADLLLRDVRKNGLFLAAFSRHDAVDSRFLLQGAVESFYLDAGAEKKAFISLTVTLKDLRRQSPTERIVYQKTYADSEALKAQSPEGFALAMSAAMKRISKTVMDDIYVRARQRVSEGRED